MEDFNGLRGIIIPGSQTLRTTQGDQGTERGRAPQGKIQVDEVMKGISERGFQRPNLVEDRKD